MQEPGNVKNVTDLVFTATNIQGKLFVSDDELAEVRGLVTEDGLFDGTISTRLEDFYIEPVSRYVKQNTSVPHFHSIVYRSSDVYSPQLTQPCASQLLHLNNNAPHGTNKDRTASVRRKETNLADDENDRIGDIWNTEINEDRTVTIENKRSHKEGFENDVTQSSGEKENYEVYGNGLEKTSSKVNFLNEVEDKERRISEINRIHKINLNESESLRISNNNKVDVKSNKIIGNSRTRGPGLDAVSRSHRKNRSKRWPSVKATQPTDPSSYTGSYQNTASRNTSRLDTYYYNPNVLYDFPNGSLISKGSPYEVRHVHKRSTIDPKKTTCMLYLQADHLFYQKYGTEEACIEVMTRHVQRVNSIYKLTGKLRREEIGHNNGCALDALNFR